MIVYFLVMNSKRHKLPAEIRFCSVAGEFYRLCKNHFKILTKDNTD